jgi:ribokinase
MVGAVESGRVFVVGRLAVDVTAFNDRLPKPGETLLGESFHLVVGGKGANQALCRREGRGADVDGRFGAQRHTG